MKCSCCVHRYGGVGTCIPLCLALGFATFAAFAKLGYPPPATYGLPQHSFLGDRWGLAAGCPPTWSVRRQHSSSLGPRARRARGPLVRRGPGACLATALALIPRPSRHGTVGPAVGQPRRERVIDGSIPGAYQPPAEPIAARADPHVTELARGERWLRGWSFFVTHMP